MFTQILLDMMNMMFEILSEEKVQRVQSYFLTTKHSKHHEISKDKTSQKLFLISHREHRGCGDW